MISRKFNHMGLIYEFKWAKRQQVIDSMPKNLANKLNLFFDKIYSDKIPYDLFNNRNITRCSNFRIKGLNRGALKKISQELIEKSFVGHIVREEKDQALFPLYFYDLCQQAEEARQEFESLGFKGYKPSHDEVLTRILLKNENTIALETPVWTRRQTKLTDFIQTEQEFCFSFNCSLTGHIDLLMFDSQDDRLVVVDYKPEGVFLRSLPQVATYGLLLKRILGISEIKCISFRKEDAWVYDPEILRTVIEKLLKIHGDPLLKWRKIIQKI